MPAFHVHDRDLTAMAQEAGVVEVRGLVGWGGLGLFCGFGDTAVLVALDFLELLEGFCLFLLVFAV